MGYYFLGLGVLISGCAAWAFSKNAMLLLTGVKTNGKIIGVDRQWRRGNSEHKKVYYHPVIEFESIDGRNIQFTFGSGSARNSPDIGSTVSVIYDKSNPNKATLNSFLGLWAGPLAAVALGATCVYAGLQLTFFKSS